MADFLPPAVQKFIADTKEYNEPINRSADQTTKFGRAAEEASIVAQRALNNAAEASRKLAIAQDEVKQASDKLRKGLIDEGAAAEIAAKATKAKERADLAVRESAIAAANAADKEAAQFRQVARDAALMEASVFIANTQSTKSGQKNRKELEALTKAFPELGKQAEQAMGKLVIQGAKAGAEMGMVSKIAIPAVIEAIAHLPFIAGSVGGAVTILLGGAFTAVGLKASASSASAKAAISDMTTSAKRDIKEMSKPFIATWNNIDIAAHDAFHSIEPSMQNMFTHLAAATSLFVRRTGKAFFEFGPMFDSLGLAYKAVMDDLGGKMPNILHNVSTGFTAMFDAITAHPEAITSLIEDMSILVRGFGDTIAWLTRAKQGFATFFAQILPMSDTMMNFAKWMGWGSKSNKSFTDSQVAAAKAQEAAKLDSDNLVSSLEAQRTTVDQLKQAFDRFTGANQSAATAEINMQQAIDDTTATIKANGQTLDTNTQKGRDNYKQLIATAKAFQDKMVAMKNDGATSLQLSKEMGVLKDQFYKFALQMTGNARVARALTDQLLGVGSAARDIPTNRSISIKDNAYTVRQHIADLQRSITNLKGKTVTVNYLEVVHRTLQAERAPAAGGYVAHGYDVGRKYYSDGGPVSGLGSQRSDSIPAMISNGEYVINAKQTRKHFALLQAINFGLDGFAKGGMPKVVHAAKNAKKAHFTANTKADYIASNAAASRLGAYRRSSESAWMTLGGVGSGHGEVVQHITHVTVMGSLLTERMLDDRIQEATLQRNIRNPTSGTSLQGGRIGQY